MRTLLTGATGFIGAHLLPHLGHPVVLSRPGSQRREALDTGDATVYDWSPTSGAPPLQAFDEVDVVVHLAGESIANGRWTRAKKERIRDSRVLGTQHLVEAMSTLPRPPRLLISASAVGYYGSRGDDILDESSTPGGDFLAEVCVAWEAAASRASEAGIRVVLLRQGIVLGSGGGALASMLPPFRMGLGGTLGSGRQWISWISLDDLIQLILFICRHETIHGVVNATSPNPVTNAEFASALGQRIHRPTLIPVPTSILRLAVGELADALLASQRVVPSIASRAGFEFQHPDIRSALAAAIPE